MYRKYEPKKIPFVHDFLRFWMVSAFEKLAKLLSTFQRCLFVFRKGFYSKCSYFHFQSLLVQVLLSTHCTNLSQKSTLFLIRLIYYSESLLTMQDLRISIAGKWMNAECQNRQLFVRSLLCILVPPYLESECIQIWRFF